MKTRSFGMNLWTLFSAAILFFVSSSCEGGECDVFSQRSVETNNTAEYLTHLLEEARKTCAYRGFPELVARFEPLISVTEASSQDSPNYDMDSINGSHRDAVSTDQPQSLDYWIWDPAEEYYCDPSSSNCPREPEVVTPHPVTLARKDIVLPRDVKSLTLNIVLDVEASVEFHEVAELDELPENTRLSLRLTSTKGDNNGDSSPALNYRVASLGSEAEVLVFVTEGGYSQLGLSSDIYPGLTMTTGLLCFLAVGFICGPALSKLRLSRIGRFVYRGLKGQEKTIKSGREKGQAIATTTGQTRDSDTVTPELLRKVLRRGSESLGLCERDRGRRKTDSRPGLSPELRHAYTEGHDNGGCTPRSTRLSLADHHVSVGTAPPKTSPKPRPLTWSLVESNHPSSRQNSTLNTHQGHHQQHTANSMSSSADLSPQSSVCAGADFLDQSHYVDDDSTPISSLSARPIRPRLPLRGLALLLFGTLVLVAVAVGVSKIRAKPTLHVVFPGKDIVRKVRMFSDFPDLSRLSRNHSSLSLVSRLQLLDTKRCRDQLQECKVSIVCDPTTRQGANCRCRTGYYFKDWKCHECSNHCPADHYLVSSCSADADAICRPCTVCGETQYEAAGCVTDRDTICVDVSFPVGILPMNRSHLPDDGFRISVTHSPNVFLERLVDMVALETPMYITNNQQGLLFVWPRTSGLEIAVQVSGVYLVPEYRDLHARDDTTLFNKLHEPTQSSKDYYKHVQDNFCRHPLPDYYYLELVQQTRASAARVVVCDSTDPRVPKCPPHYKDGTRFVQRFINTPCPMLPKAKVERLTDVDNSVVCSHETVLLRDLFDRGWDTEVQEWLSSDSSCEVPKQECMKCINRAGCSIKIRNYTFNLEDNRCCGLHCFNQSDCKKSFAPGCPEEPQVACAQGELDIFSLYPEFHSMEREFACHLKYTPPQQLYSLSYSVMVPSIGLNISEKHFSVVPTSPQDHQQRLSRFDFIQAAHDTRFVMKEDVILQGDHAELSIYNNMFKPYRVRWVKTPEELQRRTRYTTDVSSQRTFVQFEKPFLYSSSTWKQQGCYKNMSQIYPNQTIYGDEMIPMLARKTKVTVSPTDTEAKEFKYQMYHQEKEPFVKFYVDAKESILQYLQGSSVQGILVPSSLYGRVTWHHDSSTWQLLFAGKQLNCPTVISLKIFTQLMTGCAGHFDILINCPEDFTVTFNLTTDVSDLPDVFVLQANDSRTSHNLVLSSLYSPLQVDELPGRSSVELSRKLGEGVAHQRGQGSERKTNFILHVWLPLLAVVVTAVILLLFIYGCYSYINSNIRQLDYKASMGNGNAVSASLVPANSSATSNPSNTTGGVEPPVIVVALNNQGEKANHMTTTTTIASSKDKVDSSRSGKNKPGEKNDSFQSPKMIIVVFILLYIIYSLVFSFSATFGMLYLTQAQVWSNVSNPENLAQELHVEVDRSLSEIRAFENGERKRIFESFLERRRACVRHLELENTRLLSDYDSTMRKQLHTIFMQNGTLHQYTAEIQRQNVSAYVSQIKQFVDDCNKTVNSIVDLFQANYLRFLRDTVLNNWLEVPRHIFLQQEGETKLFVDSISTQQIKQFASWLDIDKVKELLNVQDNVFGRLNSLPEPQVTTLDMMFPSAHPGAPPLPTFNSEYQTFSYIPLEPPSLPSSSSAELHILRANISSLMENMPRVTSFSALGGHRPLVARHKRGVTGSGSDVARGGKTGRDGYNSFGLSGSLKANPDSSEFSDEVKLPQSSFDKDGLESKIASSLGLEEAENGDFDYDYDYEDEADILQNSDESNYGSEERRGQDNSDTDQSTGQKQHPNLYMHPSQPSGHDMDVLPVHNLRRKTELVSVQTVPMHTHSNLITDEHKPAARYDTLDDPSKAGDKTKGSDQEESKSGSESWLYGLIAMFLTLDVVLWAYRLSWLSRQLHAARHGYADRIPTDDACKQVIEIQTAYHLPAFDSSGAANPLDDSSSGYYVDGKDHSFYASDLNTGVTSSGGRESSENMTFLQALPRSRDDSILQKIWQQKMSKAETEKLEKLGKGYTASQSRFSRHWLAFCAGLQRLFLSQLIWQVTVTFLAIILLCLLVHCASFWLTEEHFCVLVGAQSAVSDVQFQLHASDHHLRTLAHTLSQQLQRLQKLCDAEVDSLTSVFFDTVNMQTSMFTSLLQELCREAKGQNCDSLSAHLSTGGRIVGCSFLPLQAQTYHDLSLTQLEAVLAREVTPLLERSRRLLALSACVVAFLLCSRLVCQAAASTARHYLLLRGYLPRVRVYQAEETHNAMLMSGRSGAGASTLQRSQSWVDSCESGVYVCEADDGGMNNSGGAGATVPAPSAAPKDELVVVQPTR